MRNLLLRSRNPVPPTHPTPVSEDQTYSTAVSMRFRLEDGGGRVVWDGVAMGSAHQWGSPFKEENYVEEISDALKRTYANRLSNSGFQKAWAGSAASGESAVSSASLKAKVREMMNAGISEETIVAYARDTELQQPLSADEILEWKREGIAEGVIRAALGRRN